MKTHVRPSAIAGRWYSANSNQLAEEIDRYIKLASIPNFSGEIIGIVSPHAGYIYSGAVAGYAYAAVKHIAPEYVVVISPFHHYHQHSVLTSEHTAYATPLGEVKIAADLISEINKRLKEELGVGLHAVSNDEEHSLEIQLPFLQRTFPNGFQLIPIMVREVTKQVTFSLGKVLAKVIQGKKVLIVASTDLSHFYTQKIAEKLDKELLHRLESFIPESVLSAEEEGVGFACGRGALVTMMVAGKELGANRIKILHYATSGDVSGDYHQVVGYASAVMLRE